MSGEPPQTIWLGPAWGALHGSEVAVYPALADIGMLRSMCLLVGDDPVVQRLLHTIEEAQTLTALLLAVWPLARALTIHVIEAVLTERAQQPTSWPPCPTCGTGLA